MTPERQKLVESLFLACIEAGPQGWPSLVESRCGSDLELRAELQGLLDCHLADQGVLDRAAPVGQSLLAGLEREALTEVPLPPTGKIGHYKVVGVLGAGGMGVVYVGEQERPRRTVAIKVLRPGYGRGQVLRRMEHEVELLGRLQHPGIARIYEAGTADAWGQGQQPFFAMELVDGPPITEYARSKGLNTRQCLALLIAVCDAVQHAHQRGVVHRDLKPGNILVGTDGQPKVLDFGVARTTDNDLYVTTMRTSAGQMIGTLPYMSPEQVAADPDQVDTRTDVYALGVLLYELLGRRLPHDVRNRPIPEAARIIRDETPARLGTLKRELRGEIETIAAKAMEKDKARRYQSAVGLADDLRRHLDGQPINARRDSALYVLRKTLVRNKVVAGLAALVLGLLVGFAVYASVQAGVQRERALGEQSARLRADAALVVANDANARSEELNAQLKARLRAGVIERGRMSAAAGNGSAAEAFLWPALLEDPSDKGAWWALRELYSAAPCDWDTVAGSVISGLTADETTVYTLDRGGALRVIDGATGQIRASASLQPPGRTSAGPAWLERIAPDVLVVACADGHCRVIAWDGPNLVHLFEWPAHVGPVNRCVTSPDGRTLATVGEDGFVRLWSLPGLTLVREWPAHDGPAVSVVFSPDGRLLATGSRTAQAATWRVDGSLLSRVQAGIGPVNALAFTRDGQTLFTASSLRNVMAWNSADGSPTVGLGELEGDAVAILPFPDRMQAPDTDRYAVLGGLTCRVVSRLPVFTARTTGQSIAGFTRAVWCGDRLVTASADGRVRAIDTRGDSARRELTGPRSWAFSADFAPDGNALATTAGDGQLRLYDPRSGALTWSVNVDGTPLDPAVNATRARAVAFVNPTTIATGAFDGKLRTHDDASGAIIKQTAACKGEIYAIDISADRTRIATVGVDRAVRVWDAATLAPLWEATSLPTLARGVAFSPDGRTLYTSGGQRAVLAWDAATGEPRGEFAVSAIPWAVAVSPDGQWLAVGTLDAGVDILNLRTGERKGGTSGHLRVVAALAFSPDSAILYSGGDDGTVKAWEVATARLLTSIDSRAGEVPGLAITPDGQTLAICCALRKVFLHDLYIHDRHVALAATICLPRYATPQVPPVHLAQVAKWAQDQLRKSGRPTEALDRFSDGWATP